MEMFGLLFGSQAGLIAFASVSLAVTMVTVTLGALAYKANQVADPRA